MCWKCGNAIIVNGPVSRTAVCEACGKDLRSCRNCRFYSPGSYHDCAERVDEAVYDKERSNFCDLFSVNPRFRGPIAPDDPKKESGKNAFDSLFN